MNDARLDPGTILADKYRLEGVLGIGGMGTVYRAEHLALKAPVAIKVIDREVAEGDVALARFMREAQSAASLRSPHVVQILDYGMEGNRPFMVMEMLEGEPLADRIKRLGRLSPQETYRVISHVARAVSRAHEADIIHRDLKPDNVFLVHNEGDEIAKVLDFGVAKVESTQLDGEGHTRTGSLLGTPYYMSPEQAQGNKHIDARSDLWALGVIAFECLTGKRPFSSDGLGDLVLQICIRDIPIPSKVVPVPEGFDEWFKKACTRDPDQRFQTARQLALELRPALGLGSEPGGSVPESRWSKVASLPHGAADMPTIASEGALGAETTQPDPRSDASPHSDEIRTTDVDAPTDAQGAGEESLAERDGSQWEVVPHGEKPRRRSIQIDAATSEEESSGGSSIAFVAIIALLIGGAVVFGMRQAGFNLPGQGGDAPRRPVIAKPTDIPTPPEGSKTSTETTESGQAKSTKKGTASGDPSDPSAQGNQKEGEDAAEEGGDAPKEGDALQEIEDAAEKAVEARDGKTEEGDKKAEEKNAGDTKEGEKTPTKDSGPQPKLPDGLAPAPAPPPPPK